MMQIRGMLMGALAVASLAGPAFAHSDAGGSSSGKSGASGAQGGGGAQGSSGSAPSQAAPPCAAGMVMKDGTCQHAARGVLPDDALYAQGRALALAGYYRHALPIFEAIEPSRNPMVYTMHGYALRKLGQFDAAMNFYDRALALDPDSVNAHEYIGEGYVTVGRLDVARTELATVRRLCGGTECEQYEDLARAIRTGRTE